MRNLKVSNSICMITYLSYMRSYVLLLSLCFLSCRNSIKENQITGSSKLQVIGLANMHKVVVGNGETVYQAEGKNHGIENMSFVITETEPGGGPPLHTHPTEEAHVVLSGTVTYFVADSIFTVTAPYIVRIPPNTIHTFMNTGDTVLNLVGVFGQNEFGPYKPVGNNPLKKALNDSLH